MMTGQTPDRRQQQVRKGGKRHGSAVPGRQERAVGHRDPSLVPYLLLCAGVAFQRHGWGAGRPFYDRAQLLRGPAPRRRAPGAPARATS